ncbi:hypothetical protein JKF63_07104 [Porcisia hertigi]|uniref:Uncharacterized protein n=1 Tax=Porcisia hertigi TaxID=2761500 RepID=A0A836LKC7_9TRYP|nr:hypothetical protein JKF63_07104 [Porcisia hertigi]
MKPMPNCTGLPASADGVSSDDERAPDLEVEASPPQDDVPPAGEGVKSDVNASYFSDYAPGPVSWEDQSPLPPLPSLGVEVKEDNDACNRKLLPHFVSYGDSVQAMAHVAEEGDADVFCDAERRLTMASCREASSLPPLPKLDATAHLTKSTGFTAPLKGREVRCNNWMDPLRAPSTRFSKDAAVVHPETPHPSEAMPFRGQSLSDFPVCASESRRERWRDRLTSHRGPSVMLSTGTGGPSPPPRSELSATASCTANGDARGRHRMSNVSSSRASGLDSMNAVHVLPLSPLSANGHEKDSVGGVGVWTASPTTSPRVTPRSYDSQISLSPRNGSALANSPPQGSRTIAATTSMAQPTREDVPLKPAMILAPERAEVAVPGMHVVRDRLPRGAPLILQCTGDVQTPTRTLLVDATQMEDDESEVEKALTAGLHTNVYKETGERSGLSFSSSFSGDEALFLKYGQRGSNSGPAELSRSPKPGPGAINSRTLHVTRSSSPLVSLADAQFFANDPATVVCQQRPESHHGLDASPSRLPPHMWKEEMNAAPDLIDFSVQTEALGSSQQGESLILCEYSVEPIPASCDASASSEVCHRYPVPPCQPFLTSKATGATAPSAAFSAESRALFSASQNMKQLQVDDQDTGGIWARPRPEAPFSPCRIHLEGDVDHAVPHTDTHLPQCVAHSTARSVHDLSNTAATDRHKVRQVIESVEEVPAADRRFLHSPHWTTDVPGGGDQTQCGWGSAPPFTKLRHYVDCVEDLRVTASSSALAAPFDESDSLALKRERERALHALLVQQTQRPDSSGSPPRSYEYADRRESVHSAHSIAPAAHYVSAQERRRGQRLAAESERARLSLVLAVCEAVRPHARDLLFVFLLLMEESRIRHSHTLRGTVQSHSEPTLTHSTTCCPHLDSAALGESRVTYYTCAEAVNCVLERHGVTCVRATRELCRRVVAWCQYYHNCHTQPSEPELLLDSLRGTADETSVEYAAFISALLEFAAQYPNL